MPVQLRLWSIAADSSDVHTKLILLFQIIELEYPEKDSFQIYNDPAKAPHPLAECKFVRHLIAHSGDVESKQLKLYCKYLGLPEVMLDITDPQYLKIISEKISLLESEAEKIIKSAL